MKNRNVLTAPGLKKEGGYDYKCKGEETWFGRGSGKKKGKKKGLPGSSSGKVVWREGAIPYGLR